MLKKNPRSHFIGEKERIRVGIDSGSGSESWSLRISLPLTLNGEGSRRGPAGRAWTEQAGVLRLHPGRLQSLPHTPSILSALLGTKSNPPRAREGGAGLCWRGRGLSRWANVERGGARTKAERKLRGWLSIVA